MKKIPSNARNDRNKGVGASTSTVNLKAGFQARCEEKRFKKPKAMSFAHKSNVMKHILDGTENQEYRFVLIDYRNENEQIKARMMSHRDAAQRNQVLRGTGLAWAKTY